MRMHLSPFLKGNFAADRFPDAPPRITIDQND
jgi:hypothetical protein